MARLATLLTLIGLTSPVWAQIEIPPRVALGEPIVATLVDAVPEGAAVAYTWTIDGGKFLPVDGGRVAHIWAGPGRHSASGIVAIGGVDGITVNQYTGSFVVGDPPPTPDPGNLADLVSAESAAILAEFHSDWAAAAGTVSSRAIFDTAYQSTREALGLTDAAEAYAAIDGRLATAGTGATLVDALTAIAAELGGDPDPPDPTPTTGPRIALIIHETEDDTPAMGGEFVKLRSGPEHDYLAKQGHKLIILDDDTTDGDGNRVPLLTKYEAEIKEVGLPALIIVDPKTEKTLAARQLKTGFTAANVTEYIRQAGG